MKTKLSFLVSFLICFSNASPAQEFTSISGKVQDAISSRPLSFASIQLLSAGINNVTNSEGIFVIKFPNSELNDTVFISYLGYKSQRIPVKMFIESAKTLNIKLEQSIATLKTITVKPQDAASVLKMAFARLSDNYIMKPMQITAFYREMIKKGNSYVSLNEAVLDVTKASYSGYKPDVIGIYKARGNYDASRIDTLLVKLQGGPNSALELDILSFPFLGADLPFIDQIYEFRFASPVAIDDKTFFVIEFNERGIHDYIYFRGRVFIEAETLAIGRIEFAMNVEDRKDANIYFIKRKPPTLKMDILSANYVVNYKMNRGKWYFDYSRAELKFSAKWDKKWFRNTYTVSSEFAVTDLSENLRKISDDSRIRPREIMSNRTKDYSDLNFWGNYNIIEPERSIEDVISKIIKQLRNRDK